MARRDHVDVNPLLTLPASCDRRELAAMTLRAVAWRASAWFEHRRVLWYAVITHDVGRRTPASFRQIDRLNLVRAVR